MENYTQAQIDEMCLAALNYFQVDNGLEKVVNNLHNCPDNDSKVLSRIMLITNRSIAFRAAMAHAHFLLHSYGQFSESLPPDLSSKLDEVHRRQFETLKRWNESYDIEKTIIENFIENWQQ